MALPGSISEKLKRKGKGNFLGKKIYQIPTNLQER